MLTPSHIVIVAIKGTNSTFDRLYDILQELEDIIYYTTPCELNPTTTMMINAGFCDYYNDLKFVGLRDITIELMVTYPDYKARLRSSPPPPFPSSIPSRFPFPLSRSVYLPYFDFTMNIS